MMISSETSAFVASVRKVVVGLWGAMVSIGGELFTNGGEDDDKEDEEVEDDDDEVEGVLEVRRSDAANSASMSSKSSSKSAFVALAPRCLLFAVLFASLPPFLFFLFVIPVYEGCHNLCDAHKDRVPPNQFQSG
jgi:hypothetical protein